MNEERCNICELMLYSCICAKTRQEERATRARHTVMLARGWFPSNYPVKCRECREQYEPGTLIKFHPEYDGRGPKYVAECCGEKIENE